MQTREKEVIAVLSDKTHPQIRSIDRAFQRKYGRTLVELLDGDKILKGNCESVLPFFARKNAESALLW